MMYKDEVEIPKGTLVKIINKLNGGSHKFGISSEMKDYEGRIAKIIGSDYSVTSNVYGYTLDVDNGRWTWASTTFNILPKNGKQEFQNEFLKMLKEVK